MNKGKSVIMLLLAVALLAAVLARAESGKQAQPAKIASKTADKVGLVPNIAPQVPASVDSRQGYRLVTDVLDSFAGRSESANYRIPVNSGGQPSPIGVAKGTVYDMDAGFVYASKVDRGDPNADGIINLGDAIYTLNYLFKGGPNPCPMEAGDANCTGVVDLGDAIYILNYLFKGGPAPVC